MSINHFYYIRNKSCLITSQCTRKDGYQKVSHINTFPVLTRDKSNHCFLLKAKTVLTASLQILATHESKKSKAKQFYPC